MAAAGKYKADRTHPYLCELPHGHNGLVLTWKEIEDTIRYEVHKLNQSEI